jgi:hypothetical protein
MPWGIRWGTKTEEELLAFPCDRYVPDPDAAYYRGITIQARPEVIFRWLCQMRVAPYSYDLIDNLGRRSPQTLTPGLNELAVGQHIFDPRGGFELAEFEYDQHFTVRTRKNTVMFRILGDIAASYLIVPQTSNSCRLLVKVVVRYPGGALGRFMRLVLPWGDRIMMSRQMLNFKKLSEQMSCEDELRRPWWNQRLNRSSKGILGILGLGLQRPAAHSRIAFSASRLALGPSPQRLPTQMFEDARQVIFCLQRNVQAGYSS